MVLTTQGKKPFENIGNAENGSNQHFQPCLLPYEREKSLLAKDNLLSENVFDFQKLKILTFGKGIKIFISDQTCAYHSPFPKQSLVFTDLE